MNVAKKLLYQHSLILPNTSTLKGPNTPNNHNISVWEINEVLYLNKYFGLKSLWLPWLVVPLGFLNQLLPPLHKGRCIIQNHLEHRATDCRPTAWWITKTRLLLSCLLYRWKKSVLQLNLWSGSLRQSRHQPQTSVFCIRSNEDWCSLVCIDLTAVMRCWLLSGWETNLISLNSCYISCTGCV